MERARAKPAAAPIISRLRLVEVTQTHGVFHAPPQALAFAQTVQKALDEILSAVVGRGMQARIVPGEAPVQAAGPVGGAGAAGRSGSVSQAQSVGGVPAPAPTAAEVPVRAASQQAGAVAPAQAVDPELSEHPLVRKAIDLFGARVVKVRPKQAPVQAPVNQPPAD